MNIIDGVIEEPLGGAHRDFEKSAEAVKEQILTSLKKLKKMKPAKLVDQRIEKYSAMGVWLEADKKT
jgi:acetyl-CoA carboxylase carboxyl transferase subunit alpha